MKLSYKWLKNYVDFNLTPEDLADTLTMLGAEVEEIIYQGAKYKGFVIGLVEECIKHPEADKLSLCKVTDGEIQYSVVCGAPNVRAGQKAVFGKIGATVPAAGFKLEKRKIRGEVSEGMLCAQTELELGTDASGIWVLPDDAPIGMELSKYLDIDDTILDVFLTPNKADCLSHIGIARDLAACIGTSVKYPEIKYTEKEKNINEYARVTIVDKEKCPRYCARVIKDVKIVESPQWLKNKLTSVGLRSISAPVDITNFVLMEYGQPLHAFDLDKLAGREIIVKCARDGEKFITLDGKERTLTSEMLMICDSEKPLAVGGVMGGQNSEITSDTTNILLESAYFKPASIRRTARKLGILSDASYRYERGVNPEGLIPAADRAAQLFVEICGGKIAEGIIDVYPDKIERQQVKLRYARAAKILGFELSNEEIKSIMSRLGFVVLSENEKELLYEVSPYRVDVKAEIDLIEELARLYNYDKIEPQYYSPVDYAGSVIVDELAISPLKQKIADYMAMSGYKEIVTQHLIDPKSASLYTTDLVELANPLNEEMAVMRPTVIPSMMKIISHNQRMGNHDLQLFEIGKVFRKSHPKEETFISGYKEMEKLIIIISGSASPKQWSGKPRPVDFYDIKGSVEGLLKFFNLNDKLKFKEFPESKPGFSKNILAIYNKKQYVGVLGEVDKKIKAQYDIKLPVYMAVIDMEPFYSSVFGQNKFKAVSPYPTSQRDLAFEVAHETAAGDIYKEIVQSAGNLLTDLVVFDVYEGKGISEGMKSVAYALTYGALDRTLKDSEVDNSINNIVKSVEKRFNARLRSS
ncbi:MAG: phenylalanine--tRNA ligase subunit beta [bacterium]